MGVDVQSYARSCIHCHTTCRHSRQMNVRTCTDIHRYFFVYGVVLGVPLALYPHRYTQTLCSKLHTDVHRYTQTCTDVHAHAPVCRYAYGYTRMSTGRHRYPDRYTDTYTPSRFTPSNVHDHVGVIAHDFDPRLLVAGHRSIHHSCRRE